MHYNVWDEITYPFLNFNSTTVEVWEWISNSPYTSLGMWLTMSVKWDPGGQKHVQTKTIYELWGGFVVMGMISWSAYPTLWASVQNAKHFIICLIKMDFFKEKIPNMDYSSVVWVFTSPDLCVHTSHTKDLISAGENSEHAKIHLLWI